MTQSTLHIVCGDSAAGLLRQALKRAGRPERVLAFPDNLSFGPINPPDPDFRFEWRQRHLGESPREWDWLPAATNEFWSIALSATEQLTVWTSRRTTLEYSGLLEWVWRCEDRTYNVVDFTDLTIERRRPDGALEQDRLISLGLLNPDHVPVQPILDRAGPLPASTRDHYRQMWEQLRADDAPLRVIQDGRLYSAPITQFAEESWVKALRVIGRAMGESWDDDGIQVGDVVLGARVKALVELGHLDGRGDLSDWRHSEVRLAAPRNDASALDPA